MFQSFGFCHLNGLWMQFADVEYKVKISQASSNNPVKAVVSKVASQFEHDNYKQILKGITGRVKLLP